jgi:hypothetical protein
LAEKGIMVWDEVKGSLFLVKAKSGPTAYKCSHMTSSYSPIRICNFPIVVKNHGSNFFQEFL